MLWPQVKPPLLNKCVSLINLLLLPLLCTGSLRVSFRLTRGFTHLFLLLFILYLSLYLSLPVDYKNWVKLAKLTVPFRTLYVSSRGRQLLNTERKLRIVYHSYCFCIEGKCKCFCFCCAFWEWISQRLNVSDIAISNDLDHKLLGFFGELKCLVN